jgi:hypothetical protein
MAFAFTTRLRTGSRMQLLYDPRDAPYHEKLGSRIHHWLGDLGAVAVADADPEREAFLFAGARPIADYRALTARLPLLRDRPDEREPLLRLDTVLAAVARVGAAVPMPRTWTLPLDAPLPEDLTYPLFLRTVDTSWKKGGRISKVKNRRELEDESGELRRAFGWDATILAREWLDLEYAGKGHYGPVAQEVRVWIVDGAPLAWSFHYMNVVRSPAGFPPSAADRDVLRVQAGALGAAFRSCLVAADFARGQDGHWWFIEAGPGSCSGTGHQGVFKAVATKLKHGTVVLDSDNVGGLL